MSYLVYINLHTVGLVILFLPSVYLFLLSVTHISVSFSGYGKQTRVFWQIQSTVQTLNCLCILSRSASMAAALMSARCSASNAASRSSRCFLHIFCSACIQPVTLLHNHTEMVGVDDNSLQVDSRPKCLTSSEGWQPLSAFYMQQMNQMHFQNHCHDDNTTDTVSITIIISSSIIHHHHHYLVDKAIPATQHGVCGFPFPTSAPFSSCW